MSPILIIFLLVIAIAIFIIPRSVFKKTFKMEGSEPKLPYVKKPYLMTNAEREFFFVLERAVQGRYYIVPQVQLSRLVQVEKGEWHYQYKNRINLKSVDFVLFDKEYFTPQIVIELDDSSHQLLTRKTRDSFVASLFYKLGIKFVRFPIKSEYIEEEIKIRLV